MEQYLTVKQFAEQAGVSTQRIYQLLTKSLQPFCKIENGNKYLSIEGLKVFNKEPLQEVANDLQSNSQRLANDLPSGLQEVANDLQSDSQRLANDLPSGLQEVANDLQSNSQRLANDLPSGLQEVANGENELLKETIEALKQQLVVKDEQLAAKDKQLSDLTAALVSAQEQHKSLTDALTAAQALHAGTIQERLNVAEQPSTAGKSASVDETSLEHTSKKRNFFSRLFRKSNG